MTIVHPPLAIEMSDDDAPIALLALRGWTRDAGTMADEAAAAIETRSDGYAFASPDVWSVLQSFLRCRSIGRTREDVVSERLIGRIEAALAPLRRTAPDLGRIDTVEETLPIPGVDDLRAYGFRDERDFLARYPGGRVSVPVGAESIRRRHVSGHCGPFAVALSRRTGWGIVLLADDGRLDNPRHLACRAPDGMLVDANGRHREEDLTLAWSPWLGRPLGVVDVDEEWVLSTFRRHPATHEMARVAVAELHLPMDEGVLALPVRQP